MVKLSYAIETKEKKLKDMLDLNECLGYNVDNLTAPSRLEHILLAQKIDITFPKKDNVVRVAKIPSRSGAERHNRLIGIEKGMSALEFLDFFSGRAEAQVKEK